MMLYFPLSRNHSLLKMKIIKEEERRIRDSILRQRAARDWGDDNYPLVHRSWCHPSVV